MNQKEKEAEKMKNNLEIKEEEISSLTLSLEAQQKMIAENETELRTLKHDLVRAENMSDKVENLQLKLSAQGIHFFLNTYIMISRDFYEAFKQSAVD